jgi:uncharacterized repeat protein (TIGR01451 family)
MSRMSRILAGLFLALSGAVPAIAQNIVSDPSFENATLSPWTLPANPKVLFPWAVGNAATTGNTGASLGLTPHSGNNFAYTGCANGNQAQACVVNGAASANSLTQTLTTVAGNSYELSVFVQNVVVNIAPAELLVTWGGATAMDLVNPLASTSQIFFPGNAPDWIKYGTIVTAASGSTAIVFYGRQDPWYFAIDDVNVSPLILGKVIIDTGVGGGIANDGIQNGSEAGHTGVTVSLTNCAGTTYSSAITGGSGNFSLSTASVPAGFSGSVCVTETLPSGYAAVSSNPGATGGSYTAASQTLKLTLNSASRLTGIVFGEVPQSTLSATGTQQVSAGQIAIYPHTYTAGDNANVVFSTSNAPTPVAANWTNVLYLDTTCSGTLTASDPVISAQIAVTAGQSICLLDKVMSPAGASPGMLDIATVTATETYTPAPTIGAIVHALTRTDTTTITPSDLTLLKQVRNVATCPSTAADVAAFATSNQANPGSFVEYQITFSNTTTSPLTSISINDAVPAFTLFQNAQCAALPAGEASCTVTQAPALNATSGAILWALTDSAVAPIGMKSGASGTVRYCVKVAQ